MTNQKNAPIPTLPSIFVIFGATGDLAKKRIFPAFLQLTKANLLDSHFKIIACARTDYKTEDYIKYLEENLKIKDLEAWSTLSKKIEYLPVDLAEDKNLEELSTIVENFEKEIQACPQRIFYMAISPTIFEQSIQNFGKHTLAKGCQQHNLKPRIIVEKPFGEDLESAKRINSILEEYFTEDQIYRIDHYLGKETVQNIFSFRFGNEIFEPIWNNKYIDHVQITTAEYIGVEKRGESYDKMGALRDITQNHQLQLLTLIGMEEPDDFTAQSINQKKLELLQAIKPLTEKEVEQSTVRGQYENYQKEEKISQNSQTETYSLIKLNLHNPRWEGVPFYLRTGKRLTGKVTSIIIQLKEPGHKLFKNFWDKPIPNTITIQIQPNAGIGIRLVAKKPGLSPTLAPVDMEFCYKTSFDTPQPDAYERLLLDVIQGDQSLFMDQRVIEQSWRIIDPIEKVWQKGNPQLHVYKPGTWGPEEADEMVKKDNRQWLAPLLTICKI